MSDADRLALEGLRLFVREVARELLAEERPTSPAAAEGFIGVEEAARHLGVKGAAVRKLIRSRRLAAVKLDGVRGWKIKPSDLAALMAGVQRGTDPGCSRPIDLAERARRLGASIPRGNE